MNKLNHTVQGLAEISLRVHDLSPSSIGPLELWVYYYILAIRLERPSKKALTMVWNS